MLRYSIIAWNGNRATFSITIFVSGWNEMCCVHMYIYIFIRIHIHVYIFTYVSPNHKTILVILVSRFRTHVDCKCAGFVYQISISASYLVDRNGMAIAIQKHGHKGIRCTSAFRSVCTGKFISRMQQLI